MQGTRHLVSAEGTEKLGLILEIKGHKGVGREQWTQSSRHKAVGTRQTAVSTMYMYKAQCRRVKAHGRL